MIIDITYRCNMGCSHCLSDCKPGDEVMTRDIFMDTLGFIDKYSPKVILVTGGEPLERPDFFEFMDMLKDRCKNKGTVISILSNGMFLDNEELTKKVIALDMLVQITNDSRYYPRKISKISHKNFVYIDKIEHIYPQGRAVSNNIKAYNTRAPKCFNMRSIACHYRSFTSAFRHMENIFKFCTPFVRPDGSIGVGESRFCKSVGTINSSEEELTNSIINFRCNNCKMEDMLPQNYRSAIGLD